MQKSRRRYPGTVGTRTKPKFNNGFKNQYSETKSVSEINKRY
jgi:hypothetical protein